MTPVKPSWACSMSPFSRSRNHFSRHRQSRMRSRWKDCFRGSHTHTLVVDPNDKENVYIYVSGTSFVRQPEELAGCSGEKPDKDPNTALFRIDVIKVPLNAPKEAKIVSSPRVFMDARTGAINGLANAGNHDKAEEEARPTDQCHDITVYSAIGMAAGACEGNGILLDIKDPVHPVRLDA